MFIVWRVPELTTQLVIQTRRLSMQNVTGTPERDFFA
jgi:hypothetical protein